MLELAWVAIILALAALAVLAVLPPRYCKVCCARGCPFPDAHRRQR